MACWLAGMAPSGEAMQWLVDFAVMYTLPELAEALAAVGVYVECHHINPLALTLCGETVSRIPFALAEMWAAAVQQARPEDVEAMLARVPPAADGLVAAARVQGGMTRRASRLRLAREIARRLSDTKPEVARLALALLESESGDSFADVVIADFCGLQLLPPTGDELRRALDRVRRELPACGVLAPIALGAAREMSAPRILEQLAAAELLPGDPAWCALIAADGAGRAEARARLSGVFGDRVRDLLLAGELTLAGQALLGGSPYPSLDLAAFFGLVALPGEAGLRLIEWGFRSGFLTRDGIFCPEFALAVRNAPAPAIQRLIRSNAVSTAAEALRAAIERGDVGILDILLRLRFHEDVSDRVLGEMMSGASPAVRARLDRARDPIRHSRPERRPLPEHSDASHGTGCLIA
jgi:hypothetical protein